jgi:non-specific serine/threonine protein kinase/serine/threonine-protein kinase
MSRTIDFQRLTELFEQALELDGTEREAYITAACDGDVPLETKLRRLLRSDAEVRGRSAPRLPRFGVFQARELVGTGGMGAVYRATREDGDVRQQVAVKVVGSVLWSAVMDDRFRRERQILAELIHPNIARFLDSGVTENGTPYLVMELVEGERIDSWCEREHLGIAARLKLFLKVCAAVSFAHQKLIVHRDLKPGNILIAKDGEPKLLDFGVARTLDPGGIDGSPAQTASLFFTPLYASPELLRGEVTGVGCDVYSLAVLLYELRTGTRPFGGSTATPARIIEQVLSAELRLPSAAVSEGVLRRALQGDLDAIVAKGLAKSPRDRYASVEQLAADVRRYLDGFPVQAASTGAAYRAGKFLKRHRTGVAAAAIVIVSIAGGLAAALWQSHIAERRFAQTRELARYMMFDLTQSVGTLPGATPVQTDMVTHSLEYLDRLAAERTGDGLLRIETGEGYARLAALLGHPSQNNLGDLARAKETYRKAIAMLEPAARDAGNLRANLALAKSRFELGQVLGFAIDSGEGVQLIEAATKDFARLVQRWPDDFDLRIQASVAFEVYALALSRPQGYIVNRALDRSLPALRVSREHAEAAARIRPGTVRALRQLAMTLKVMADFTELIDHAGATELCHEATAALDRVSPEDRTRMDYRNARSSVLLNCGDNLRASGDFAGARTVLEEARQLRDGLSQEDPRNALYLRMRLDPYTYLLRVSSQADQLRYYSILEGIFQELLKRYPGNESIEFDRAAAQASAANLQFELRRADEAARMARISFPSIKRVALEPQALAVTQATAAAALDARVPGFSDPKLALELARRADSGYESKDAETLSILARAYAANGDRQSAAAAQQRALSLMAKASPAAREEAEKKRAAYSAR